MRVQRYTPAQLRAYLKKRTIGGGAQQFLCDAQALAADVVILTTQFTAGPTTNFIPIPYNNAKIKGIALALVVVGAGTTTVALAVLRNPGTGQVQVNSQQNITVIAGNLVALVAGFTDPVPDNRAVQYQLQVVQNGATGNGTFKAGSYIEATVLSG